MTAESKEAVRSRLQKRLSGVPASVNAGSTQFVQEFKDFHGKAMKTLANRSASLLKLQAIDNQSKNYYP
jgi:hypothetical protein